MYNRFQTAVSYISIGLLVATGSVFAQDQSGIQVQPSQPQQTANPSGGWKRVGDTSNGDPSTNSTAPNYSSNADPSSSYPSYQSSDPNQAPPPPPQANGPYPYPSANGQQPYPQAPYNQPPSAQQQPYGQPPYGGQQPGYGQPPAYGQQTNQPSYQAPPPVPTQLTIPAGTFITARVNQLLSSDRNQAGDAFSASLVQPIVVNGVVVAEPGQTLGGRVAEAVKAGHIEGVARLGIQLTTLSLVDGQQLPIQCQLISRKGPTSVGQDAGTIAATTGLGAAVGAAADWGRGAAIGAGAGAAVGIIGVLVTRGHPSIISPEQILTFKLDTPVTISTAISPQAFRYVQPNEYDRPYYSGGPQGPGPSVYAGAPAYPYPYAYPYYGYPYYWGPSFAFYWGPGWYGRGWYGGYRGYVGGRYYGGRVVVRR